MSGWPSLQFGAPGAPPVVMLHGFIGRGADWQAVAEALAVDHFVLCPDLPGHGTHTCSEDAAFDSVAESLAAWLVEALPQPHAVVGYSLGGRLALAYAMRHPERVSRLVLESASPGLDDLHARESRAQHDDALAAELESLEAGSAAFRAWLEAWYATPLWESLADRPDLLCATIDSRADANPPQLARALRALSLGRQPDFRPVLHALLPATLLITGERDRKFTGLAEEMASAGPRIAHSVMTGCGHNVHLENPEGYTTVLRSFLKPRE
ncbi:MAG: 2-succinyl-6-hydroxy-2,4-cyclohexadiene-1-carboxylate synthase [Candidatus Hydrogenedens sp.]|nr:2-succinyl-6-hydroxy-2,4-cyclohexadiene-1-carboxylate synthase [Candidatus Hydrogenedens sp.]